MLLNFTKSLYVNVKIANEETDYKQLKDRILQDDNIAAQLYFLTKQSGKEKELPEEFHAFLKEKYEQAFMQNFLIKTETLSILKKLDCLQIEAIPLKGTFFAEKYFGDLGARPTSDIDLLIHSEDLEKAVAAIKELGFTKEEKRIPGHFHHSFSKKLPHSQIPLTVELHWNLLIEQTATFQLAEFWRDAQSLTSFQSIKQLSVYHTFYFICLHGWRHNLDSLKYFIDIIQLIHQQLEDLDYERLLADAADHQTKKRLVRTLSIVYQQFPHLSDVKKFPYFKKNRTWQYRPKPNLKQYIDFIDYQFLSYENARHQLTELKHWLTTVSPLKNKQ